MELNRKAHPDCVYASNPYHECASACLERIAQGKGRKETKKQASKLLSLSGSFSKKRKEIETQTKPHRNGSLSTTKYPAKDRLVPPSHFPKENMASEKKKSFSSLVEHSGDLYARRDSFYQKQDQITQTMPLSANNMPDHAPKPNKDENNEKNNGADARSFSFISPPRSCDNDESNGDGDDDDKDDGEVESVVSDSCVSVGKYHVKSTVSSILRSIMDKHGDIAANCKLKSASMLARYLECLCSVIQELKATPFDHLTKIKVKEMLAVLKDLETVNIDVSWLRRFLEELMEAIEVSGKHQENGSCEQRLESLRRELETREEDLARKEKEVVDARAEVDEIREKLGELELQRSRLDEVKKFRGKSFIDKLL